MNSRKVASPTSSLALVHDHRASARATGLRYVNDRMPGISRVRCGKGFSYRLQGTVVRDREVLARIRALAIPPAWTHVWVCPHANGHLQATGRDAKGRKQYRYHAEWSAFRGGTKFLHVLDLARRLPAMRRKLEAHLALPGLPKEKVLATVVSIMDRTHMRVGHAEYARTNNTFGLSTLKDRHVKGGPEGVRFVFRGKTGVLHDIRLKSERLSRLVMRCKELPGQELFQYIGADGEPHPIGSEQVNAYIAEITGGRFTGKDLRTWMGTVCCFRVLAGLGAADSKAALRTKVNAALDEVARHLGNTRAVCRKYYVHPQVITLYERQELVRWATGGKGPAPAGLLWEEQAVMSLLSRSAVAA